MPEPELPPYEVPNKEHAQELCDSLAKAPQREWEPGYPRVERSGAGLYRVKLSSEPGDWHPERHTAG